MDIKQLVAQMTLEEKARFCSGADFWHVEGLERLGIPSVMVTDGPCGLRKQAGDTDHLGLNASVTAISYPTGSCVACSFDRDLLRESGEVLGEECQAEDVAVLLGPAVNIKRSPLCGRNFEYFSEDPYLAGELSAAYIKGVQSKNVGTSLKHFAANSMEHRRMTSDSLVDERTLREIYLPAFEKSVKEAKPWTVMCSYNKLNGDFASESHRLLTEILRDEWGFEGAVMSDWGAVNDRVKGVPAGMDLEMPGPGSGNTEKLVAAVQEGRMQESDLDTAVERILGFVYKYVENRQPGTRFDYERDHQKARQMAAESMVLLKNDGMLPLDKSAKVAFIGKFADEPRFQGGGSSHVSCYKVSGSVEAAKGYGVTYAQGYGTKTQEPDENLIAQAVETAGAAECAVVFIGITDAMESEGFDRKDMQIPACQQKLLEEVLKVQPNTAVVVECGSAIEMPWIGGVKAVLYAYLGGEAVGPAIVDLLYGDVNPSGKLAETFPMRLEDNPSYLYYFGEGDRAEYREGIFVGYRYYDKKKLPVLFPFGHGLSYTQFAYSGLTLDKAEMQDTDTLHVSVKVKNTGSRAGKEIVQLYVGDDESTVIRPVKELKGFEKVELQPGEEKVVAFTLDKRAFAYYNVDMAGWHVESGDFTIMVGRSSAGIEQCAKVKVESTVALKKVWSLNSTVGDVMADPKGAQIMGQMMQAMNPLAGAGPQEGQDESEAIMAGDAMAAMMNYMPLRGLIMFAGGAPEVAESLQKLIDSLNA
ncbi:glycoside hydrolase family 3 C-terminal domain-containing protein [Acutalibacter caecimuris]|uniref:glycoside hydrolase family 3 C-terminal domain-containing protein n=1 Tax=Acutalibacter caecimuris TaxID=3093657 RepID=UPI002AC8DAF9|nr:glycoside hydrolase family 3 C-terminal domain-containing protein [Acutalibacter sp. M00118]